MKKINWANILMDLIYLVLGVVFIVRPADLESKMCYILACVMGAIGLAVSGRPLLPESG